MKKIDKIFKNKLSEPQQPPVDSWDFIANALPEKKSRRKVIPIWFYWTTAASIALIGTVLMWNNLDESNANGQIQSVKNSVRESSVINKEVLGKQNSPSFELDETQNLNPNQKASLEYINENQQFILGANDKKSIHNSNQSWVNSGLKNLNFKAFDILLKPIKTTFEQIVSSENSEEVDFLLALEQQNNNDLQIKTKKIAQPKWNIIAFSSPTKFFNQNQSLVMDDVRESQINNQVTLAYGAKVNYQISDRFSIRTGISKMDIKQSTNDVMLDVPAISSFINSSRSENFNSNINYNSNVRVLSAKGKVSQNLMNTSTLNRTTNSHQLNQSIGYVEIPVEAEFKFIKQAKFNVGLVAGTSAFILTNNQITAKIGADEVVEIGEANNVNDLSFSGNAGVKFQYQLSDKISINLEPNMRYLMNSVENVASKNQTILGVNTGLSINF